MWVKLLIKFEMSIYIFQIPDHDAENDQLTVNPNIRCPGWQFISMPINPGKVSLNQVWPKTKLSPWCREAPSQQHLWELLVLQSLEEFSSMIYQIQMVVWPWPMKDPVWIHVVDTVLLPLHQKEGKPTALVNTTTMPTSTVLMLDLPLEQMILMYANSLDTMQMVYQFMDSAKIAVVRFRFFF